MGLMADFHDSSVDLKLGILLGWWGIKLYSILSYTLVSGLIYQQT